jgi:hypothetical protein
VTGASRARRLAIGALALMAGACARAAETPAPRFDLVCDVTATGAGEARTSHEQLRLSVDLSRARFCTEAYCGAWTKLDARRLEHRCRAERTFCDFDPTVSTAGPSLDRVSMVVDLKTGAFHREEQGSAGDPASHPYHRVIDGQCTRAAYTGLHGRGDPPVRAR